MTDPRPIPDERDQIYRPQPPMPDLRCLEHGPVCEVVHSLHARIVKLEQRVAILEKRQ